VWPTFEAVLNLYQLQKENCNLIWRPEDTRIMGSFFVIGTILVTTQPIAQWVLSFLNRALWYNYVIRTIKMHTRGATCRYVSGEYKNSANWLHVSAEYKHNVNCL
jgi:hypothetical protein